MTGRLELDVLERITSGGFSGYESPAILDLRFHDFIRGIDLVGKRVLDIGCGIATYCVVAEAHGAAEVIGLEPAGPGSRPGLRANLETCLSLAKTESVAVLPKRFQDFDDKTGFDLILSINSINHLDENACKVLQTSRPARAEYERLLSKVHGMLNPGGTFVISDAGRRNLFAPFVQRGLFSHPFVPTIDWTIHQEPRFWSQILIDGGFSFCRWSGALIRPLRALPRLARSRALSLATRSQFVLHAYKDRDALVKAKWTTAPLSCFPDE